MAKPKMKLDVNKVKQFLLAKGEKIVLAVALIVGVLLVFNGLSAARKAGFVENGSERYEVALTKGAQNLTDAIARAGKGGDDDPKPKQPGFDTSKTRWDPVYSSYPYSPIMSVNESGDYKRRNPMILAVPSNDFGTNIQIDYVLGGVQCYEIDRERSTVSVFADKKGAAAGGAGPALPGGKAGMPKAGPGPRDGGGQQQSQGTPVVILKPRRLVVVHASFPMKQQYEEFAKELRMHLGELLGRKEDHPRFRGIDVIRLEKDAKGEVIETKLYWYDAKSDTRDMNRIKLFEPLDNLFRESLFDEDHLKTVELFVYPGTTTPLPKLANAVYPPVRLDNIKAEALAQGDDDDKGPRPADTKKEPVLRILGNKDKGPAGVPMAGGGGPGPAGNAPAAIQGVPKSIAWKKIGEPLFSKFSGDIAPFDPLGLPPVPEERGTPSPAGTPGGPGPGIPGAGFPAGGIPGPMAGRGKNDASHGAFPGIPGKTPGNFDGGKRPGMPSLPGPNTGGRKPPGGGKDDVADPAAPLNAQINDALIRFVDVDVEPGKTYSYKFRVRMWSPNYGRKEGVAFAQLAEIKELTSAFSLTPEITIPSEVFVYNVDQHYIDEKDGKKHARGPDTGKLEEGTTVTRAPIQIHRWMGEVKDREGSQFVVADWVIAERLLVRRGEYLGRSEAIVQVPSWNKYTQSFEVVNAIPPPKTKSSKPAPHGIALDFTLGNPAPLLVDFDGGPRNYQNRSTFFKEDSSMDLLILNPDGTLLLRNTAQDTDDPKRLERYDAFRARLKEFQHDDSSHPQQKGPAMPGKGKD